MKPSFLVLIIAIIALLIFTGFYLYPYFSTTPTELANQEAPILSVIGEVIEKDASSFRLKASKEHNTLTEGKTFSVLINSQTIFTKMDFPEAISGADITKAILSQPFSFADLQINDKVSVVSVKNIRNQPSFTARSVQITNPTSTSSQFNLNP